MTLQRLAASFSPSRTSYRSATLAAMLLCAGHPLTLAAALALQPSTEALPASSAAQPPATTTAAPPAASTAAPAAPKVNPPTLSFNFKDTPIEQALDFFARECGVPIIFEAPAPAGTITFLSPSAYSLSDALSILNLNLARHGVHLRRQDQYLYLATLADSMKKPAVVSTPDGVNNLTPDLIVTVSIPLDNARADLVAEQIKPLVTPIGGIIAIQAQNMIVLVDTAAQVKRLRDIIASIDAVRPSDSAFRLFPLRHAQAETVLNALKGLVGEKITTVIVDKDGQKRTIQEQNLAGLNLAADARTNSIVGVGSASRLKTVEELLALLDTPETANSVGGPSAGSDQQMQTFSLSQTSPAEAALQLNALFAAADPKKKPVVIPLESVSKITVVGPASALVQAAALLAQIDPDVNATQGAASLSRQGERRGAVIPLRFAAAATIEPLLTRLLPQRLVQTVKFAASPDGRAIVVTGPAPDVAQFEQLITALDVHNSADQQVKVIYLSGMDAQAVAATIAKAKEAYTTAGKATTSPISVAFDEPTKAITLIAPAAAIKDFEAIVSSMANIAAGALQSRTFTIAKSLPSSLAAKLNRLAAAVITTEPRPLIEPIDETKMIVIRAREQDLAILEGLIQRLDGTDLPTRDLRIIPLPLLSPAQAVALKDKALALYSQQIAPANISDPASVTLDPATNSLLITAPRAEIERFAALVAELDKQAGPVKELRLFELRLAKAKDVADFLQDMASSSRSLLATAGQPPVFEIIESTNSILAAAQPQQFTVIDTLIKSLDSRQAADRPPVRILKLRSTDAANLAQILQKEFDKRPIEQRGKEPVSIEADLGTNTLIVSATSASLAEIEQLVTTLNETDAPGNEGRELRIFPLKVARAEELAQTIDQMFPQPPIPLDPRTRQPRPDLQPPREVVVRADRATNSLVVDAPAKRLAGFEQIVKSLDATKISADVIFRTYRIERADINAVARTIRDLAAGGALTAKVASAPTIVNIEPSSKTLIISTHSDAFPIIEEVIAKMEETQAVISTDLKLYPLTTARAERLQPIVQRILSAKWQEIRLAKRTGVIQDVPTIDVTPDAASNTLIISAPKELIATADALIASLDAGSSATASELRVFRFVKGSAPTSAPAVAAAIKAQATPGEPEATVTPEPTSNTLTVVGTSQQVERAATLIKSLDVSVDLEGMGVKTIPLTRARAVSLAPVLQKILESESALDKLPEWAKAQAIARGAVEAPKVRVAADARMNAIVISGPKALLDLAEQVVTELDKGDASQPQQRTIRVLTLQNADAQQTADNITAVFADEQGVQEPPTLRVDPQANSLIIKATDSQLEVITQLVASLDNASATSSRQLRTISVDKSKIDALMLAKTIERLMKQQGGTSVEVISAEELIKRQTTPKKTSLHIIPLHQHYLTHPRGSRPLAQLLTPDDGPAPLHPTPSFLPLTFVLTLSALSSLSAHGQDVTVTPPQSPQASAAPAAPEETSDDAGLTIAVDEATNSIIVVGSPRATDRVAQLARQLSEQLPGQPPNIHIVTLAPGTDATALAQLLTQTITQLTQASASTRTPGGFTGPVSILSDPAGGALIVLANDTDFPTIANLIANVAAIDTAIPTTIKVVPLANITAQRAIQSIRDLFSAGQGAQAKRLRTLDVTVAGPAGTTITADKIDPALIRITSDPSGTSLLIAAPTQAMPLIDALIETIDQTPVKDRLAIRRYSLANARAQELASTFQTLFDGQRQGPNAPDLPQARFVPDERTNTLLVTAAATQHAEVERLLASTDASAAIPGLELAIITLQQASPEAVRKMAEEVLIGKDPARRESLRMSAQEGSNVLIVRAKPEDIAQVRALVAQLDSAEVSGLPVRAIKLQRADAAIVAQSLQQFFAQRAQVSSRPGQRVANRIAISGDKRTATLVVCASDEDFKQVQSLVTTFDSESPATDMIFRIIPLKNTRTSDITDTIRNIIDEVRWTAMASGTQRAPEQQVFIETNEATNTVILLGQAEQLNMVEKMLAALDVPTEQRAAMAVRSIPIKNADLQAVKAVLERAFSTANWRSWRGPDPAAVTVQVDRLRKALILVGKLEQLDKAAAYIAQLDEAPQGAARAIEAIALNHARADRAANNLRQFFTDRARAQGIDSPASVSIIGSTDGNVLIVSAQQEDLATLKDLIAQIDQPDSGKDRRIEVFILQNGVAKDTADVLRSMFTKADSPAERVIITPQPSTNALVLSAPDKLFDEAVLLLKQLDAPPKAQESNIETIALATAKASDVAVALRASLPPNVKVTVTPVVRSNSLILTGSKEAIALVVEQVKKIDTEPMRSGAVFRRYTLANADAAAVSSTLEQVLNARPKGPNDLEASVDYSRPDNTITVYAPADQIAELETIIKDLDIPLEQERTTQFVKLDFANARQTAEALKVFYGRFAPEAATPAARNVTILSDPLSNSLVIRADPKQWEGIRALLTKLDTPEYDTKRQLAVIPLTYADAASIARALNEGFRAPLEEQFRQAQARLSDQARANPQGRNQLPQATVLIDAPDLPSVSAEPQTNSLVIFAGQSDLTRITLAIKQLDISGFAGMPAARIIPLKVGKPSAVASTIRELFLNKTDRGPLATGPRAVLIIGDDASGALIVRADDEKFAQVKALADTLDQQGQVGRAMPHVIRLNSVSAARLRATLLATFTAIARDQGETLAIEVDRTANALVIAASPRLLEQINNVIKELDAPPQGLDQVGPLLPAANLNHSVSIVDVTNNAPADIKQLLEELGVTKPIAADRQGIVSEPVTISVLSSRRALAVVAGPADARAIESLIAALDSAPTDPQQTIAIVPLKMASAKPVVDTLLAMLSPTLANSQTGPARALAEQVRRLGILRNGANQPAPQSDRHLDLSKPIRLLPDIEANSIVILSTPANVEAAKEIIKLLDTLPIGDAVIVRIFPMSNASASRVQQVITQLFSQGEALRRLPGTRRQGLPLTATGQALAGEIAAAIDERTNTLIVAGREEAVALVEVLIKDLDSDRAANWIEPAIIPLLHADATTLARKLQEVLVRGIGASPESMGLQKQFGRLRIAAAQPTLSPIPPTSQPIPDPAAAATAPAQPLPPLATIQADLFAPVTGLVITADEQLNALIVVATPANIQVVRALVAQLDVPAASASNSVRIFPLQFAASERVASILSEVFRQRESLPDTRPEDKLIITSDSRTNALIVATSPKSTAIVEGMLKTLDGEKTNFSVGLHILPVMGADARTLAPRIDRLMRERISAAAQSGSVRNPLDAFSIEAEPLSNLLIIASSDENLAVVKELLVALTADAAKLAAGERIDMVQLTKARAAEAASSLTSLYVEKENLRRGPNAVSVTPNERLNALIFSGTEQDMIELRSLAKKIDTAEVAALQQIKWIELKSANANEAVSLIESVIAGRPVGGGRGVGARQASKLQFLREQLTSAAALPGQKPTEAEIDGAIKDQVTLTADARTNSIWITAPEAMVTLITEMILEIERSSAGARKIERFTLKNADARQMADLLRDTFKLEQRGNAMVLLPQGIRSPRSANPADNQPIDPDKPLSSDLSSDLPTVTAVPDERQQLAIAVDARTNTLIVSGTAEYLELVRKVITELDGITANERDRRVYSLRNAKAREIELTLRAYFRGENDSERVTLGPQLSGSLMRRLEQEVTVVGDEKSNKLVISTSPRYMQTVLSIVDELDTPPPQVMIQVLLAEVTIDTSEQWGMDVSVGPFGGEGYQIGSLGGGTGVATALGVPNLSVTSADFGILIRSLEAQGKLEILSNPQVTVNNNQKAEINVGDEIGVAGSTERSSIGTLISSVERLPVGIIMNVTPAISDDGFVRMEITPEISQLTNRTTQINRDQTAPIIARRKVDTVVTVKDGQSVVIGGLIQTTQEERRSKIPILGDIPIIGIPFRTKLQEAKKTELLVIVTPRVIPGLPGSAHGMAEDVSIQQMDRMEDPSRVLDYLENIKADIKAGRSKQLERDAANPPAPFSSPAFNPAAPPALNTNGPPIPPAADAESFDSPPPTPSTRIVPPPK